MDSSPKKQMGILCSYTARRLVNLGGFSPSGYLFAFVGILIRGATVLMFFDLWMTLQRPVIWFSKLNYVVLGYFGPALIV